MLGGRTLAVGFVVVGWLTGCGSSGSPHVLSAVSTSVASSSAHSVPDTVATSPTDIAVVNTEDQTRALAAMLHDDDFPSAWSLYAPAAQIAAISQGSCAYRPDGAVTTIDRGGAQSGPTMQLGTTGAFVSSYAFVFPTEALAKEYIDMVNTDEWAACRGAQMQQFQDDHGLDSAIILATRDDPSLHEDGFESYTRYDIADLTGKRYRFVAFSLYQIDRTVIGFTREYSQLSDADEQTFFDDSDAALLAAFTRVKAL